VLVNATGSPAGIAYAAAHSDMVFITNPAGHEIDSALAALPAHNAVIKAERGRQLRTIINPMIVCRETHRVEELLAERGLDLSTKRSAVGCSKFGPAIVGLAAASAAAGRPVAPRRDGRADRRKAHVSVLGDRTRSVRQNSDWPADCARLIEAHRRNSW
jgi:alkanesulfonate monooxygenase SsuD/methylene tetrahydromethanopterin reductase-like flavin-dependent oxidoreductase (luciferase family)